MRHRSTAAYWNIASARDRWQRRFMAALDAGGFEAIICPGHTVPAMRHGASRFLLPDSTNIHVLFNVLGMPAGVVTATRVRPGEETDRPRSVDVVDCTARKTEMGSAGLPVGVQVAARHWREDVVLAVMGALEGHFRQQADYPDAPPC
jgi:fatty acid amide hydrolase